MALLVELHEALAQTAPASADIEFSIKKIDEVIAALNEFKANEKYKNSTYQNALARLIEKMEIAKELHNELPKLNPIKKRMDDAKKAGDLEAFRKALSDWYKFQADFKFRDKITKAKRKTSVAFKVSSPYVNKLINLMDTFVAIRDAADREVKMWNKSPAQKAAAAKASARMKAAWYE